MALKIDIKGAVSDLKAKIGQAKSTLSNFASSMKSRFAAIGTAIVAAFAFNRIIGSISRLVGEMDKIGKASDKIGITTKAYQEMSFAAELAGVTMERFTIAMSALGPFMLNAANSASRQAKALTVLGIEYKELAKLSPEEQFKKITKEIDNITNATERVGISRLIFGRAGFEVLGMARNYEDAVRQMREAGAIIKDKDIKDAEKFNDTLSLIWRRMKAIASRSGAMGLALDVVSGTAGTDKQRGEVFDRMDKWIHDLLGLKQLPKNRAERERIAEEQTRQARRKKMESEEKSISDIFGETVKKAAGGGRDAFRVDELRRIGAGPGSGGVGGPMPVVDVVERWLPLVVAAAESINRKTPDINEGGRY